MKYSNFVLTIIAAGLILVIFQVFRITEALKESAQTNQQLSDVQRSTVASQTRLESALVGLKEEINKASDKFGSMAASSTDLKETIFGLKEELGRVNEKMGNK